MSLARYLSSSSDSSSDFSERALGGQHMGFQMKMSSILITSGVCHNGPCLARQIGILTIIRKARLPVSLRSETLLFGQELRRSACRPSTSWAEEVLTTLTRRTLPSLEWNLPPMRRLL